MSESNWSNINSEITKITNQIKSNFHNEDNLNDIKDSLVNTLDNLKNLLNDLSHSVDKTIKDDEIKSDVKNLLKEINQEFAGSISIKLEKFNDYISSFEEE